MTPEQKQAAVDRLLDDAERQGFPRKCSDPAVLATIAPAIRPALDAKPTRKTKSATASASVAPNPDRTPSNARPAT